jgi:hypothetical protein
MPGKSAAQLELDEGLAQINPPPAQDRPGSTGIAFRPAFAAQVYNLALLGIPEEEMADVLGISLETFYDWKANRPAFRLALAKGGKQADGEVARGLYRRAVGMKSVEKVLKPDATGVLQVVEEKHKTLAPDVTAASTWLANRHRGKWRAASAGDATATLDWDAITAELEQRRQARLARPGDGAKVIEGQASTQALDDRADNGPSRKGQ